VIARSARVHPACQAEAWLWSAAACCRFSPGQLAGRQDSPIQFTAARASSLKESGSLLPHSRAPATPFIHLAELSESLLRGGKHLLSPKPGFPLSGFLMRGHVELDTHVAPLRPPARRRLSTREFEFDPAQKAVFWPLFGVRFEFVCIKNQFVLAPRKR
jgi:hypothetical protein